MSSSFFKLYLYLFIFIFIITLFVCLFTSQSITSSYSGTGIITSNSGFVWPLPNYSYISSYFGYRNAPTSGASTYHSGIDIPAPAETPILSICSGVVTFASWGAGGGYTIVVNNPDLGLSVSYCHVSPNFIVCRGNTVNAGNIISAVGPKNVYGIINNPYKDVNGNPTNGASTGSHLHLTIKKNRHCCRSFILL